MSTFDKVFTTLAGLTVIALLLRGGGQAGNTIITSAANASNTVFGTFLNAR